MMLGERAGAYDWLWSVPPSERDKYFVWASFRFRRALWRLAVTFQATTVVGAFIPVAVAWLAINLRRVK